MKFKDFLNERTYDDCPATSHLLDALQKSFVKYCTDEKYKNRLANVNMNFSDSLIQTNLFGGDGYEETVSFYAVCAKYEAMANFIKSRIREGELNGSITSIEVAYNVLRNMHKHVIWDHDGEEGVKKQIPVIFQDIKSELMSVW